MIVLIGFSYAGTSAECPTDHFPPIPDSGRWVNGGKSENGKKSVNFILKWCGNDVDLYLKYILNVSKVFLKCL